MSLFYSLLIHVLLIGLLGGLYAFKKNPIPPDMYHWWFIPLFYFLFGIGILFHAWNDWILHYVAKDINAKPTAIVCSIAGVYFIGSAFYNAWKNEFHFRIVHLLILITLAAISLWVTKIMGLKSVAPFFMMAPLACGFGYNVACQIYRRRSK